MPTQKLQNRFTGSKHIITKQQQIKIKQLMNKWYPELKLHFKLYYCPPDLQVPSEVKLNRFIHSSDCGWEMEWNDIFPWAETDSGERYVVRDFVQFVHRDQTVVGKIKNFNLAGEVCININLCSKCLSILWVKNTIIFKDQWILIDNCFSFNQNKVLHADVEVILYGNHKYFSTLFSDENYE